MTYFITIEELKQTTFNANLDNEYIVPALEEAQSIYLREIIGDLLYNSITSKIDEETLSGKYLTLVNQYIKPYLTYKVQSVIVIPLNNKTRNAGIINQYDQGFNTSTMKDTAYLADYYNSRAEFYANRLTTYLQKNAADFPEYGYSDDNITQPTTSQNVTGIFLGGVSKKGCGCMGTGTSTTKTVDWNNITNKPDFADVATSGDYEDLDNKPEINNATLTIKQGGVVKGTFSANASENVEINLQSGGSGGSTDWSDITNKPDFATVATSGDYDDLENKPTIPTVPTNVSAFTNDAGYTTFDGDYNSLTNKPTIPVVPTNVSAFTNDAGYTTFDGDYNSLTNKPTIPVVPTNVSAFTNDAGYLTQHQSLDGYATESWVQEQGFSTFSGSYNDLTDKPSIPTVNNAVMTIKQGGVARGTFSANANENVEINLDAGGAAQVQADWNEADSTAVDYIKNKPTIPTVPTNVSAFTNDAGYTTFSGNYNDLTNKPTIPAAQVNSDWNANSGVAQILNKPSLATVATSGDYDDLTNKPTIPAAPVQSDWNQTDSTALDYIKNKPTIPSGQIQSDWNQTNTSSVDYIKNKPNLFSGDYNDLTNKPTIPAAQVNSDWNANSGVAQILNKPSLATVATSGDYDDLQNKPTIPAAQVQTDWNANSGMGQLLNKPSLATVATTGSYSDLTNKPTIPAAPVQSDWNESNTASLAYIANKPTIPAAQVQTDWNANSGMGQLLNKPNYSSEVWTFELSGGTTVTKKVVIDLS